MKIQITSMLTVQHIVDLPIDTEIPVDENGKAVVDLLEWPEELRANAAKCLLEHVLLSADMLGTEVNAIATVLGAAGAAIHEDIPSSIVRITPCIEVLEPQELL